MQLWSLPGQRLLSSADNTLKKNWLLELKCPCLMISESPSNKFYLAYFYLSDPNNLSHFTMRFEQNTDKKHRSTANFFNCIQNCADHFIFLDSNTHFQYFILGKLNELCRGICVVIQTTMLTDSRLLAISTGPSMAFYFDLILDKIWIKVGESWKNNFIRI